MALLTEKRFVKCLETRQSRVTKEEMKKHGYEECKYSPFPMMLHDDQLLRNQTAPYIGINDIIKDGTEVDKIPFFTGVLNADDNCLDIKDRDASRILLSFGYLGRLSDPNVVKLSLEESFLLSYGLGQLEVYSDGQKLSINDMWWKYCEIRANMMSNHKADVSFPVSYGTYHYFRSRGWVIKSDDNYSCHYVLYADGPPFCHSRYAVAIIDSSDGQKVDKWLEMSGLTRVHSSIRKKTLLAHVRTDGIELHEFNSPHVIRKFRIHTSEISRFNADKHTPDGIE